MLRCILILLLVLSFGCQNPNIRVDDAFFSHKEPLYKIINIEIVSVRGSEPDPESLSFFEKTIKQYKFCNYLSISQRSVALDIKNIEWNSTAVQLFESSNRTLKKSNSKDEMYIFIAYLPGDFVQGQTKDLIGLQYESNSFAIFKDAVSSYERIALLHEFGHIFLIADDSHSPARVPANKERPHHCSNYSCIMYWKINDEIKDFDWNCRREIAKLLSN